MPALSRSPARRTQHGGFFIGLVVGGLVGLALALGVALYVTKVPIPFIDKVPQRTAEQDAAEAAKNKNWNPNLPLAGKNPAVSGSAPPGPPAGVVLPPPFTDPVTGEPTAAAPSRNPAAILGDDPRVARPVNPPTDAFVYFVQVGAYGRTEEAEAQRARLAIQGFESRISEREQAGRIVYRVRVGPFNDRAEAQSTKDTLDGSGTTTALVRVQK
ncbi:MAG: SPOR domain-containing protein [Methylibium sp.]|uniref:SPOR domain-containing protein n=1 Tax=Methylibium sp. TaxID=2067992 RepID=UPI0018002293|nr:SPOR domain-containing protein [Methylibium sp.]MBA2721657.1 SPOR domain-containing protein [Methylibium sp.]MBA3589612.1 SPOR domain-containing protein [Methylibium sp.]MBA3623899.1 SPOR domain-containing protein [Methylibium sp.]